MTTTKIITIIIIIIIIIILTLDHNKYNDDTNHRQELFVLAPHPFCISRLGLLPSKIRNARAPFLPATEIPYECIGRVWQRLRDLHPRFQQNATKNQWKYILRPFREVWFAQVSLLDVTELFPHWNWIKRLYNSLNDGNLFLPRAIFAKSHPKVLMTRA